MNKFISNRPSQTIKKASMLMQAITVTCGLVLDIYSHT